MICNSQYVDAALKLATENAYPGDDDLAKLVLICFHQASLYTGMRKSKADEKILSYNDVVLRRFDLDILSGYPAGSTIHCILDNTMPSVAEALGDFIEPLHLPDKMLLILSL
ncbi:hypothetical protein JHK84_031233 [Glycine max]|nr:hypothetical protein JHK85_031656 [Glycine max]KAG4994277.1 hypothetical protein JHK86_031104 [Glycine max]KAG5145690.1 hypothetical protein JHK84_031233 [Glycine max]